MQGKQVKNLCGAAAVNEEHLLETTDENREGRGCDETLHEPEDLPRKSNKATDHCRLQKDKSKCGL